MTLRQELKNHTENGKLDTYATLLLISVIITTLNKIFEMEIPQNESKQNK